MTRGFAGVMLAVLSAMPAAAQISGDDIGWVQIEAQPTLSAAQRSIRNYATQLDDVNGFYMGSGWYVVTLGPYTLDDADAVRRELRRNGEIPSDAFIADGRRYTQQFWPIGVGAATSPLAVPNGVETLADETAQDQAQATQDEAVAEAVPPAEIVEAPAPEPDETLREARQSESALTRDEKKDLQRMLQWAGYYNATIDGSFGRGTRGSMAAWQEANNVEATGVLTTRQRGTLLAQFNAVLEGMNLTIVRDNASGIEMKIPTGVVEFEKYEPPFAQFKSTSDIGARVILISQPGNQDRFNGLYEIMQTLEIVPMEGPRERGRSSFEIEGVNSDIHSYTYASYENGEIKGFTLVWPAGDDERRERVLSEMKASFAVQDGVLDPAIAVPDEDQAIDLVSGLAVRKPRNSLSGFFIDDNGTVLTTAAAVENCERVTIQKDHEASVAFRDDALGLAVLKSNTALSPMGFAQFQTAIPRLQSDIAVAGFSYGGVLPTPTLTFGKLADLRGLNGEEQLKRLALTAQDGDAGGPVFDNGGAVLGMLLPKSGGAQVLPAEVSFTVDAEAIIASLGQGGITISSTDTIAYMPAETQTMLASDMTVLVSCW